MFKATEWAKHESIGDPQPVFCLQAMFIEDHFHARATVGKVCAALWGPSDLLDLAREQKQINGCPRQDFLVHQRKSEL